GGGGGGTAWTLGAIGCSYTGIWYAAGSRGDALGGSVHRDRGAGWELLESTDLASLQFDGIGFDNRGEAWFACNRTSGDQLEGTVLQLHGDQFETMAVARKTGGAMHCFGIRFDVQGHGWVVGGRTPDEAFVAGTTGGACTEALADADAGRRQPGEIERGGLLLSVAVAARDVAFAVGRAEERDAEGNTEIIPRVLRLVPRPAGERDKPTPIAP